MDPEALAELLDLSVQQIDPEYVRHHVGCVDDTDLARRLSIASERGDSEIVKLALLAGAAANASNTRGFPPLFMACGSGRIEIAQILLDALADPSMPSSEGTARTPLHVAAKRGDTTMAQLLLERRADTQALARHRSPLPSLPAAWLTPLHIAALSGNSGVVGLLLQHAPASNVCAPSAIGSPLHCAAQSGDPTSTRLLIAHGAQVNLMCAVAPKMICNRTQMLCRGPPLLSALLAGCAVKPRDARRSAASASRNDRSICASGECASGSNHAAESIEPAQTARGLCVSEATGASSSKAEVTFSHRHQEVVRLLIESGASLDGMCAACPLPATPTVAGGASAPDPTESVQGLDISYTLLESCMHAGASPAVAALKAALTERAEAAMRALILEEEMSTAAVDRKGLKRPSPRQRTGSKAAQPSAPGKDTALITTDTSRAQTLEGKAPWAQRTGLASRESITAADSMDGTMTLSAVGGPTRAACNTLHATVLGRAAEAVDTREALAERARRRASVKP